MVNKFLKIILVASLSLFMVNSVNYSVASAQEEETENPQDVFAEYQENLFNDSDDTSLFEKMSNIEKTNLLLTLQAEQENLQLKLDKLRAEKEQMKLTLEADRLRVKMESEEQIEKVEKLRRDKNEKETRRKKNEEKEVRKKQMVDKLVDAVAKDPTADHSNLVQLLKSQNNGVLPQEISFLENLKGKNGDGLESQSVGIEGNKVDLGKILEVQSIMGVGGKLIAVVKHTEMNRIFKVTKGSRVDSYTVKDITLDSITINVDGRNQIVYLK